MLAGQFNTGLSSSTTVTMNEQLPVLLAASVAEQVTLVVPFWNVEPDGGVQVAASDPSQLSVTVGLNVATAEQLVAFVPMEIFEQASTGASSSTTVTLNVHCPVLPATSVAEQVRLVVPLGNVEPDGGVQMAASGASQLSVTVGVKVTVVEQVFASVPFVTFEQDTSGAMLSITVTVN